MNQFRHESGRTTADGINYHDIGLVKSPDVRAMLVARGLVWETSFRWDETVMAGSVIAASKEQAEAIADARGLGETVDGLWIEANDT